MRGGTRLPGSGSARSARPRTFASRGSLASKPLRERAGRRDFLAIHDAASKRFCLRVCARAPDGALAAIPLVSPVPRPRRLSDVCFARLLRARSTLLFGRLPLFRSSSASAPTAWPISEKTALPAPPHPHPRTHLDALSCSRARDFWPPNRVLARNPPHLKGKECSRTTKAQVGRIGAGQSTPKERRSVPERGLVARNRRFPCTRDNRQSAPPSPFGKLGAPANPTSALSRPFRHLPAATRKGRSVRRGLPSSPPASRRGAAQRKAGMRDRRPFDGCASRRAQPLSRSSYGSSCSAGAVSPPTMRVYGTAPARHQAAPFGRQTRLRSTPFRATPQLTRFTPALDPSGPCAEPPQHPSQARPRRRPRFGRESHAGCGTLGSPSRPHEKLAVPRPPAAPSKAPSISAARIRKEGERW